MRFSSIAPRLAVASLVAAVGLGLSSCGTATTTPEPGASESMVAPASPSAEVSASPSASASPLPSITPSTDLSAITVSDTDKPEVTVKAPWGIDKTQAKVLRPGGEQKLTENSTVTLNYVGINGRTGKTFDSSYDRGAPATFQLQQVVPGFAKGLTGQSIGSRVLIAMPSEDGYADGNPGAEIEKGDSILFVVDIISANFEDATGAVVAPVAGLPTVVLTAGKPELTIPAGATLPTELVVQPLIKGSGAPITAEDTIQVKYRSWDWATGKLVEDAWQPQQGPLNTLIEGWKKGLPGQTTGSRLMLVVPPEMGYPDGNTDMGLEAGQTLVYVIDVLYATKEG
ncbi:FKBP-type peptidyl-prolyl cis-trans isomerase [Tessaracoccus antarcticus]|uniref:FKBP-type peptidyl-prolyl cis-trans isomerase n=1 Tax=Tessaracoccus antarcticus TaxID=2479848 RepID=UPI001F43CD3F|nr:FKBP-type peptidyl-prolyl cis-trans isomerase [Tessaracoccus antarcticus]